MRILLADDEAKVRSALKLLLEQDSDLWVMDETADAKGLLAHVKAECPDVVLLDWELPGLQGNVPSTLGTLCPQVLLIALSGRPEARKKALSAGADAFVSKGDPPERLLAVLADLEIPAVSR
jgi:DNA-binding NarL/FixJ family response regulator